MLPLSLLRPLLGGLAVAAVFLGYSYLVYQKGHTDGSAQGELQVSKMETRLADGRATALEVQIKSERELTAAVAAARTERDAANAQVTTRLSATIASLRNRPERPAELSEAARPACTGANGAELAASHGLVLARYAARAAEQDAALAQCYAHIDSFRRGQK